MNSLRNIYMVAIAAAINLAGCASAPNQQEMTSADYGREMPAEECKTLAEQTISSKLKDPGSAQFRNEQPCFKGWMSSVPLLGMKAAFGYLQKGEVNGKNSFGGYVGFRPYMVLIKDGTVIRSCITDADGICMPDGQ